MCDIVEGCLWFFWNWKYSWREGIAIIEKYDLHKYDTQVLGKSFEYPKNNKFQNHIVVKGDTLYSLSRRYGLTVADLKKLNSLKSNTISVGQTLIVSK